MILQLTAVFAVLPLSASFGEQSYAVKGRLLCGTEPAADVRVKLWDKDFGLDPDDLLDQGYTNSSGDFELQGGTSELTPIDPVLKIYHNCNDETAFGLEKETTTLRAILSHVAHGYRFAVPGIDNRAICYPPNIGSSGFDLTAVDVIRAKKLGYRKVSFTLPKKYITDGTTPTTTIDIGVINLEIKFNDEGRKFFPG